jgi:hypothetical protein
VFFPEGDARDVSRDKDADGHRRNNHPYQEGGTHHDAEPDQVLPQARNRLHKNGRRENHEGKVIKKGTARQINKNDSTQDQKLRKRKACGPVGYKSWMDEQVN